MALTDNKSQINPYTLTVKGASEHFGFAPGTLYNWISDGKLKRGFHYLKVGNKPMIIREKFIKFMEEEDGSWNKEQ